MTDKKHEVLRGIESMLNRVISGDMDKEQFSLEFPDFVFEGADELKAITPELYNELETFAYQADMLYEEASSEDKRIYGYINSEELIQLSKGILPKVKEASNRNGSSV